jgi:hypothetical protein
VERRPENDRARPWQGTGPNVAVDTDTPSLRATVDNLTHLQLRVVLEAFEGARATRLERLAEEFEAARPRAGEFMGCASPAELSRRWRELTEIAQALRSRAALLRMGVHDPELEELLDGVIAC